MRKTTTLTDGQSHVNPAVSTESFDRYSNSYDDDLQAGLSLTGEDKLYSGALRMRHWSFVGDLPNSSPYQHIRLEILRTNYHVTFPEILNPLRCLDLPLPSLPIGWQYQIIAARP